MATCKDVALSGKIDTASRLKIEVALRRRSEDCRAGTRPAYRADGPGGTKIHLPSAFLIGLQFAPGIFRDQVLELLAQGFELLGLEGPPRFLEDSDGL